jgi:hypothetical protein
MAREEKTYFSQRKDFILKNQTQLDETEIDKLAYLSRGKTYPDIRSLLSAYAETRKFPQPLRDKYNTCDPETGNWSERIEPIAEYRRLATESGFQASFAAGFYNEKRNRKIDSCFFHTLNFLIRHTGHAGFFAAPYILIKLTGKDD